MPPLRLIVLIIFFMATLTGCASFLASQIAKGGGSQITGNFDWTVETPVCDDSHHCVAVTQLRNNDSDSLSVTLKADLKINQKQKFWYFSAATDTEQIKPLANELIVLFSGYNQPAQILALHQQWLHVITGADVWVVPGAEQAERFSFGLDYIAPLLSEISRQQPKTVHLVGFSMGALAAAGVMEHIDNGRLYLIAPMTDFRFAAKALWNSTYKNTFYTRLISDETVEDALHIVYERAGKTNQDTELVRRIEHLQSRTFIYASHDDNVTPAAEWERVKREGFQLKTYPQMNHAEMVALFRQDLQQDVTADLLGRSITSADTDIVGILCDANDAECVNRLPAEDE